MRMNKNTIVISLGGSLIVPEEIDWKFVKEFKKVIEKGIASGYRFIIITGGGKTARRDYRHAGPFADAGFGAGRLGGA